MADGLVNAENRNGSGMPIGILEAGSTGAQTLPVSSNKVPQEMLIPIVCSMGFGRVSSQ